MNYAYDYASHLPPKRGKGTLVFAWAVEAIAITMGLVLAVFAGIEGSNGGFMSIFVATLPFIALAIVETTKIPLVSLSFTANRRVWRVIGGIALVFVTVATFENFVFGFERGFNERLKLIDAATETVRSSTAEQQLAETRLVDLQKMLADSTQRVADARQDGTEAADLARGDIDDVRRRTETADAALRQDIEQQMAILRTAEQRRSSAVRRCGGDSVCAAPANRAFATARNDANRRIATAEAALKARSTASETGVAEAIRRRDEALARRSSEQEQLRVETTGLRNQITEVQAALYAATQRAVEARRNRDDLIDRSQLHRLAEIIYQSQDDEAISATKRIFVSSLAAIVALIGTIVAALHYASQQPAVPASLRPREGMVGRAIRGFLARRRRRMVVSSQERVKLIYLPLDATERDVHASTELALRREPAL